MTEIADVERLRETKIIRPMAIIPLRITIGEPDLGVCAGYNPYHDPYCRNIVLAPLTLANSVRIEGKIMLGSFGVPFAKVEVEQWMERLFTAPKGWNLSEKKVVRADRKGNYRTEFSVPLEATAKVTAYYFQSFVRGLLGRELAISHYLYIGVLGPGVSMYKGYCPPPPIPK